MRVRPLPALLSITLRLAVPICLATASTLAAQATPPGKPQQARRTPSLARSASPGAELVIVATDKSFDAPAEVDAGLVNVRLFNRSSSMQHVSILKVDRLDRLASISDYLRSGDWNVAWINRMGGPEAAPPGGVSSTSMILEPGRYVVAQLPSAYKPGAQLILSDVEELAVVRRAGANRAELLPPTDVTLTMFEWNFTLEGPLNAGRRTIRVDNKGQFEHDVAIVRLLPGRSIDQAVKWADNPMGPAPYEGAGGTSNLARGRSVNITVDLLPGDYVLLCTTYNPLSKQLHTRHGMIKQIRVTH